MESDRAEVKASTWERLKRHFTESFSGELLSRPNSGRSDVGKGWRDGRRRNAYRYISLLFAAVLLPLVFHHIHVREVLPASGTLLLLVLVLLNIVFLSTGREAPLSPFVVMFFSNALVVLSLHRGQDFALCLLYPLVVALPVLLKPRPSIVLGVITGLVLVPMLLSRYDYLMTVAIVVGLGLSWLISAWLVFAVTEQARRLREMAITDPLTGAYNRRYLELQAGKCLDTWSRHQRQFSLLLLDIDHFKWINDRFGHAVGDQAIQSLVSLIQQRMRKVDVLCRYGGEEFVLLLSETNGVQAVEVANHIREAVECAEILPQGNLTVSIGVCDVTLARNPEHWLKMADVAMYLAKLNGRNRVELAVSSPETGRAANAGYWNSPERARLH